MSEQESKLLLTIVYFAIAGATVLYLVIIARNTKRNTEREKKTIADEMTQTALTADIHRMDIERNIFLSNIVDELRELNGKPKPE